ncbi:MAG: NADH-quinone oxidoreductase subunit C [Thermoleophilia bacterium]
MRTLNTVPHDLRDTIAGIRTEGGTIDGLYARGRDGHRSIRIVASTPRGPILVRCPAPSGAVPSLLDLAPALDWDQREARDLHGVVFSGDADHRPLVAHATAPEDWTTPVRGDGVHDVAVGPIHAGVIESGHFRFHTVGERILHLDARLFYKHRGLERAAEGLRPADALAVITRACAACSVANGLAATLAAEEALGITPTEPIRRIRTLLLELERLYNHANDIGQICAGVGLAPGAMVFATIKERLQRVGSALTGHRFMAGAVAIGASPLLIDAKDAAAARDELATLRPLTARAWSALQTDPSLRDRTRGVGRLSQDDARDLGTVGPAARASGLREDTRATDGGRLWYPRFRPVLPETTGDVAARMEARAVEIEQSFALVDALLADLPASAPPVRPRIATGVGLGRVESARGATWCVVELEYGRVARIHLRTSSYANWPSVAHAAADELLPDFPLINKSFELCYACADR